MLSASTLKEKTNLFQDATFFTKSIQSALAKCKPFIVSHADTQMFCEFIYEYQQNSLPQINKIKAILLNYNSKTQVSCPSMLSEYICYSPNTHGVQGMSY